MAVFLFPGQGSQFTGMGMDLLRADADGSAGVRSLFDAASALRGSPVEDLLNADAEILKRTDASQIAITVVSLAAARVLKARGLSPSACAGFSLGEYPALAVSGVLSEEDCIKIILERGRIMQAAADAIASQAASGAAPGMAAVLGLSSDAVDSVLESLSSASADVFAANYNSPLQTVISGTSEGLSRAEAALKEAGARRVLRLKVAGPFHSPLMASAGEEFAKVLENIEFRDPVLPLFSNVTGQRVASGAEARKNAVLHISSPVRWTTEESSIAALMGGLNINRLVEAGPGKVLSGLWADSGNPGTCVLYTDFIPVSAQS